MMRVAWNEVWDGEDRSGVSEILAGDLHLFQVIKAGAKEPLQITVGTGGVNLDLRPLDDDKAPEGDEAEDCQPGGKLEKLSDNNLPPFPGTWSMCFIENHGYLLAKKMKDGTFNMTFEALPD